jgi:hypothetical protein
MSSSRPRSAACPAALTAAAARRVAASEIKSGATAAASARAAGIATCREAVAAIIARGEGRPAGGRLSAQVFARDVRGRVRADAAPPPRRRRSRAAGGAGGAARAFPLRGLAWHVPNAARAAQLKQR